MWDEGKWEWNEEVLLSKGGGVCGMGWDGSEWKGESAWLGGGTGWGVGLGWNGGWTWGSCGSFVKEVGSWVGW